jgi:hypothetical protein
MVQVTYRRPVRLQVTVEEVLREFAKRPHLILKIGVRGDTFPQRALEPFARIEAGRRASEALFTEVDDDERGMRAYFATDIRLEGNLVVGYGDEVTAVIPLGRVRGGVTRLDPERIEAPHHRVTAKDLGAFRRGR